MTIHESDFPYEEIKTSDGNLFNTVADAMAEGFNMNQVWSMSVEEAKDDLAIFTIGPPHHYINVIGYIATKETHDNNTYYVEVV